MIKRKGNWNKLVLCRFLFGDSFNIYFLHGCVRTGYTKNISLLLSTEVSYIHAKQMNGLPTKMYVFNTSMYLNI